MTTVPPSTETGSASRRCAALPRLWARACATRSAHAFCTSVIETDACARRAARSITSVPERVAPRATGCAVRTSARGTVRTGAAGELDRGALADELAGVVVLVPGGVGDA